MTNWIDDGHTAGINLTGTGFTAAVTCPIGDRPLDDVAFADLPACRKGDGILVDCLVTAVAQKYQGDELWHGQMSVYPVRSVPIPITWFEDDEDEVYLAPTPHADTAAALKADGHV